MYTVIVLRTIIFALASEIWLYDIYAIHFIKLG